MQIKRVVLGVTGGIAAYKAPMLVRGLVKLGLEVKVVLTDNAKAFVTSTTLQVVSGHPVSQTCHDDALGMAHIDLAEWADLFVIAPATANCVAKLGNGMADDLLTSLILATKAPICLFPAMNVNMWEHPATQSNIKQCQQLGYQVFLPAVGEQACGAYGIGRLPEPDVILQLLAPYLLEKSHDLKDMTILITAGPTQEAIDPVRYISNRSSGKMGYALAEAAAARGANVTLVSGPVSLKTPHNVTRIDVNTATEMHTAVMDMIADYNCFIGVAAVSDYQIEMPEQQKIKKQANTLSLTLSKTPDILHAVGHHPSQPVTIGFAAETHNGLQYAREKLHNKHCDMIALNQVGGSECAFESDKNTLTLVDSTSEKHIARASKSDIAQQLLTEIRNYYHAKLASESARSTIRE